MLEVKVEDCAVQPGRYCYQCALDTRGQAWCDCGDKRTERLQEWDQKFAEKCHKYAMLQG